MIKSILIFCNIKIFKWISFNSFWNINMPFFIKWMRTIIYPTYTGCVFIFMRFTFLIIWFYRFCFKLNYWIRNLKTYICGWFFIITCSYCKTFPINSIIINRIIAFISIFTRNKTIITYWPRSGFIWIFFCSGWFFYWSLWRLDIVNITKRFYL
jgi:hypothetical protein